MARFAFIARDADDVVQTWATDGSSTGEAEVGAPNTSDPVQLTNVDGTLFYVARNDADPGTAFGIWRSDGTATGTTLVKNFSFPDEFGPFITQMTAVDGTLYFVVKDSGGGMDLWKSDGTSSGTIKLKDFDAGLEGPAKLTNVGGTLMFVGEDAQGAALWKSDGTAAGTAMVQRFLPNAVVNDFAQFTEMNGKLYFVTIASAGERGDSPTGYELYTSDGTAAGTGLLKDIAPGNVSSLQVGADLLSANGLLYFNGYEGDSFFGYHGYQLWVSNGTAGGTHFISGANPFLNEVTGLTDGGAGAIYYVVDDGQGDSELWKVVGESPAEVFALGLNNVTLHSEIGDGKGGLFFFANDGVHGAELWHTNGTAAGTAMVKDIDPGADSSDAPFGLFYDGLVVGGILYFGAYDGSVFGLWRSDGTAAGTFKIADNYTGDANADFEGHIVDFTDPTISGTDAANVLNGTGVRDIIKGLGGDDTLTGKGGNDKLDGGAGVDTASYAGAASGVHINLSVTTPQSTLSAGTDLLISIENLIGSSFADTLIGNNGANRLDGKVGADIMTGGAGNDTYVVDNAGDVVTEDLNAGTDAVQSSLNYTLGANLENLIITGAATFAGGNELANVLTGNALANTLSGGAGNDTLIGGAGADQLKGGDGVDTASYANASAGVTANLFDHTLNTGDAAGDIFSSIEVLVGSAFNDTLTGTSAANRLDGGAGADTMVGGAGADTYIVDNAGDVVSETLSASGGVDKVQSSISYTLGSNLENLTLTGSTAINGAGNSLANTLYGNSGANTLNGGTGDDTLLGNGGHDILKGGTGADHFVFSSLNAADSDTISDFSHADDSIDLDNAIFTALGPDGALASTAFWSSTTGVAHDADDRVIYNSVTGQLYYDADGNGAGAAVLIATLTAHPTLDATDFFTI